MTDNSSKLVPAEANDLRLIARSPVKDGKKYREYREDLRYDFFHSCAYCTITEFEAQAVPMTIDHYEPRNARPDLENEYLNLMYSCQFCNSRKSDRYPPERARKDGKRFFRPDADIREQHFDRTGIQLEPRSDVGEYTIEMLDLNRHNLLRLRKLRKRVADCDPLIVSGVVGLRSFGIDQLPRTIKGRAATTIARVIDDAAKMRQDLDDLLRAYARSEMIDADPEQPERAKKRKAYMKGVEALYPGETFRATRKASS